MTLPVVQAARRAAEALMTDRWAIRRVFNDDVDPLTGAARQELVYEGPGKLQSYEGHEVTREAVGRVDTIQRMALHLPVGEYLPREGHIAVCVDSSDPNLVGVEVRVVQDAPFKTFASAYRVFVDYTADEVS